MSKNNNKLLVGVSGKMGTGKDTLAIYMRNFIIHLWGKYTYLNKVNILCFADSLKRSLAFSWGIDSDDLYNQAFKNTDSPLEITWGRLMQLYGQKMREIDPNYWIHVFNKYINDTDPVEGKEIIIIPDVRFKNEASYVKNAGGILVRINGPSRIEGATKKGGRSPDHSSETELDNYNGFDYVFDNNGTLEDVELETIKIIEKFKIY